MFVCGSDSTGILTQGDQTSWVTAVLVIPWLEPCLTIIDLLIRFDTMSEAQGQEELNKR